MSGVIQPAVRSLISELNNLIGNEIVVKLVDGTTYTGKLVGLDLSERLTLHLVLENARNQEGRSFYKVFVNGSRISEIIFESRPVFDPEEFSRYLMTKLNIPPTSIRVIKEVHAVYVYDKFKITENGVEGSGALANKLYSVLQEYLELKKRGAQIQT
ncbi:MAG: Lsm family RNA-binding protein [Desulfurococcaceae archaeon]|jgi:small nuclear ribonucleoprotein (snRNP)-like protein|nr:Lsm family RNA-binding protein [Desulfurococcaceae archaeon]